MNKYEVKALEEEWQLAVRDHAQLVRDSKSDGLTALQLHKVCKAHVVRVDAAFSRLKAAEATQFTARREAPSQPVVLLT